MSHLLAIAIDCVLLASITFLCLVIAQGGKKRILPQGFYMTRDGDMCPNCVTPWKCNGPHITLENPDDYEVLS